MNAQQILNVVFYTVTISFLLTVIYCEIAKSSVNMIQVSIDLRKARRTESSVRQTLHQEQIDLSLFLEEHPTTSEESHDPAILLPAIEEKPIEITEPKILTLVKKKELDLTNMNVIELREECNKMRIKWREAVTDIKTGKKRSLRKAEMVAALQQKLSA